MPEQKTNWRIDRRISVPSIVLIIVHSSGLVWFLAGMDSRITVMERAENKVEIHVEDNSKAIQLMQVKAATQQEALANILRTVERIDRRMQNTIQR